MNNGRTEDPLSTPLDGHLLIQASAGTGKTYALTTLVARLLVETERTIDQLLVVTFTNAATGELTSRLRQTLAATLAQLRADAAGARLDAQAAALVDRWRNLRIDEVEACTRIARSLQDFDRANVATIHSFCQRTLTEFAFDGALPFGFELGGTDTLAVAAAVRDFWRVHMAEAPAPLLEIAREREFTPAELATWTERRLAGQESEVRGAPDVGADFDARFGAAHQRWRQEHCATRDAWRDHGDDFMQALQQLRFRKGSVDKIRRAGLEARAVFEGSVGETLQLATAMYLAPSSLSKLLLRRGPQQLPDDDLSGCLEQLGDAARTVDELSESWLRWQRRSVLQETRQRLSLRAWKDRRLSFNDLLSELHRALTSDGGDVLAARIRERYPLALIDEFQDTDRLQVQIFERIYPPGNGAGGCMVVGDPKQSIYGFRGADVYAYIEATGAVEDKLHLARNYRSTPGLVRAVNALFGRNAPFLLPEIHHDPVQAGTDQTRDLALPDDMDAAPFQIRLVPPVADKPRKDEALDRTATLAANEVAELLRGGATLRGRPLIGADIAVLVRNAAHGQKMAQVLRRLGVQCVEMDDTSVFNTDEATDLHRLLAALADEASFAAAARLRGALAADLFGLRLRDVVALQDDDRAWSLWHERASSWRRMWNRNGIAALVRHLLFDAEIDCARHLLAAPGGLRRLTNVLHLADLLREAESRERLAPAGLVEWFARQDPEQRRDEATQLRLESDDDLVRIITMHCSKGLEFPIVFLPFAWFRRQPQTRRRDEPSAEYHDRSVAGFPTVLDLNPSEDARLAEAVEDQSDELRLFYVAVTRAQHRCVVTWTRARDAEYSSPAWLIYGGDRPDETPAEAYKSSARHVRKILQDPAAMSAELVKWADKHDDIAVHEVSQHPAEPVPQPSPQQTLRARQLGRELARVRQMTSYSALAAQAGAAVSAPEHDEVEAADHDRSEASSASVADASAPTPRTQGSVDPLEPTPDDAPDTFAFPRGARAGDCLHGILEVWLEPERDPDEEIGRALRRWRIGEKWAPVAKHMAENVRTAPLGEGVRGFRLADLSRPIPEMEFCMPATRLDRNRLGDCLKAHGYPHPFTNPKLPNVEGFLRGFIDLVAQHDGRWYVIDYKSNWLGGDLGNYSQQALAAAMAQHGYHLQYLLYLTALHRMLRLRLPDYAYDRHVGGALYLFLRAMRPRLPGHGVFHDLPTRECIEAIDACLAGQPGPAL